MLLRRRPPMCHREGQFVPRVKRDTSLLDLIFYVPDPYPSGNKIEVWSSGSPGQTGPPASIFVRIFSVLLQRVLQKLSLFPNLNEYSTSFAGNYKTKKVIVFMCS